LPKSIAHRPKQGFALPLTQWLRTAWKQLAEHWLLEGSLGDLGIHRPAVEQMWSDHLQQQADHTHRIFGLITLSMWRSWLDHPSPPAPMR